jgi:cysteine synthase
MRSNQPITHVVDRETWCRTAEHLRKHEVVLPTFSQLAEPSCIPEPIRERLASVDPDAPHPLNLFRVHWYNGPDRRTLRPLPSSLTLPRSLTGVAAPIVVALGQSFPLIGAHKVLAAYGCLVPRLASGQFDPAMQRAVWPSTGNYCRGGVAISRILGVHGVAVLPAGMSEERFRWLERWVSDPSDIVRTPGTESNVKEIYDRCKLLAEDPQNVVLNQFAELGNYVAHWLLSGSALARLFEAAHAGQRRLRLAAFVAASGSAGTLAAGDRLKQLYGSRTVAVEALECPTLLRNGFGEHNIQGIGDKHVPLIHNVMATDVVTAVSDQATDALLVLFNSAEGRRYLTARRGVPEDVVAALGALGISGICNVVAAIKLARHLDLGPDDAVLTVATDSAAMYASEVDKSLARHFPHGLDAVACGEVYGRFVLGAAPDALRELGHEERNRIFNLGYFTWVEQQGVALADFEARRSPAFWKGLQELVPAWDALVDELNAEARVGAGG